MKSLLSFCLLFVFALCSASAQTSDTKPPVIYAADPILAAEMFTLKVGETFAIFKTPDLCGARTVVTLNVLSRENGVTRLLMTNTVNYYADGKVTYDSPQKVHWTITEEKGNVCLNGIPLVVAQDEF